MKGRITEPWHAAIVAQESLDAICMISRIANYLYPETAMAADREAKLRAAFPDFLSAIEPVVERRRREAGEMLDDWWRRRLGGAAEDDKGLATTLGSST